MEVTFTNKSKRFSLMALAMLLFSSQGLLAQQTGDFRTKQSGNWDNLATWQTFSGGNWNDATTFPPNNRAVYIENGHAVTVNPGSVAECNNLNISTDISPLAKASVVINNNSLDVYGKIRGYAGTINSPNNSSNIIANLSSTNGGKLSFKGGTRSIINTGEWNDAANAMDVEIDLNVGQQALLAKNFGVKSLTVTNGTLNAVSYSILVEGNVIIESAGELISNASDATPVFSNLLGGNGGTLTVFGKLAFKDTESPSFKMTTLNFINGTVVYEMAGAFPVNIITQHNGNTILYGNLNLNLTAPKVIPAGRTLRVNGTLNNGGTLVLNEGTLLLEGALGGAGSITADNQASVVINGSGDLFTPIRFTSGARELNNLVIDRTSGIVNLGTPVTVTGMLDLKNGIVYTTSSALLTIKDQDVQVLNANDDSYVNGPFAWNINNATTGTSTLNFPIGKGGAFRPVSLIMTQGAGVNTYTAEQINAEPQKRDLPVDSLTHVSAIRYFSINQTGNATIDAGYIQLTFRPDDMVENPDNLRIAKSDGNAWVHLGRNAGRSFLDSDYDGNAGMVGSAFSFTTFSDFVLANAKGAWNSLPVELISFDAKLQGSQVNINWATATEVNNDRFVVERSANGETFAEIATVKGKGNASRISNYAVTDREPLAGTSYYRLKQIDTDGTVSYSKMAAVTAKGLTGTVALYPNPATDNLTIVLPAAGKVTVKVLNMLGQAVMNTESAGNEVNLNVAALPAGSYQVVITSANGSAAAKFIKTGF